VDECRLREFKNNVLRKMFGPYRNKVTGEWTTEHVVFCSVVVVVQGSNQMVRHVACMGRGEMCTDFGGETEGRRPLGRPRCKWEDNIKMTLQELGWGAWTGLI
jgi:hypothetical protein